MSGLPAVLRHGKASHAPRWVRHRWGGWTCDLPMPATCPDVQVHVRTDGTVTVFDLTEDGNLVMDSVRPYRDLETALRFYGWRVP